MSQTTAAAKEGTRCPLHVSRHRRIVNCSHTTIWLLLLALWSAGAQAVDPAEVIARTTKCYAMCRTYQDAGIVQIIVEGTPRPYPKPFKTFFIRPDYFRFEWTDTLDKPEDRPDKTPVSGTNVIWSTPAGVREFYHSAFYSDSGVKAVEDVSSAMAGATGVSLGAAHSVPSMLMPQIGAFRLSELQSLTLLPEEMVDSVVCHHIRGKRLEVQLIFGPVCRLFC
ncbi:MAG: sigE 10 [Chthoniobacteraceae bacterium]|nr:sigE 10 [Chthoniobacteraceae bacterium]